MLLVSFINVRLVSLILACSLHVLNRTLGTITRNLFALIAPVIDVADRPIHSGPELALGVVRCLPAVHTENGPRCLSKVAH
jgi:hypothetical protein